ncbi:MAG: SAM-dependent methyltransferase [Candidatus Eisenbacteria bacterium]
MDTIAVRVIARVRNGRTTTADADWGALESAIEMEPDCAAGLAGLEQWSHVVVIFHMSLEPDPEPTTLVRRPRGRADMPLVGVFAQRGRMRPNPIGITTVPIVRVGSGRLVVRGLDAVDGTPVLDLKPHAAVFDRPDGVREPVWFTELMNGYF